MTNNNLSRQAFFFLFLFASIVLNAQTIHYVKPVASGLEDGTSWANASSNLQEMIGVAMPQDQIWVAAGTYKPTQDAFGNFNPIDIRAKTFYLKDSVKIYGGFIGNETAVYQRDWTNNVTILSGDFNDNDVVTGSGTTLNITGNAENAYHVVLSIKDSKETVIDGFTIKGGNANGTNTSSIDGVSMDDKHGGGVIIISNYSGNHIIISNIIITSNSSLYDGGGIINANYSNATFINVTCTKNTASYFGGGGMSNFYHCNPIISMCTFSDNLVSNGGDGGGLYNYNYSSPIITNCLFQGNAVLGNNVSGSGGGMANKSDCEPEITNTIFSLNTANNGGGISNTQSSNSIIKNSFLIDNSAKKGGGMYNDDSNPLITNSVFDSNSSATDGGAMYNDNSDPVITNTTFTRNTTTSNSGGGGIYNITSSAVIKNCIIWGNVSVGGTPSLYNDNSTPSVDYSTIEWPIIYSGTGNKKTNPLFVDITDPDGIDNIWGTDDDGLMLQAASPAINNGNLTNAPTIDIRGKIRVGNPDMGAYEFGALTDINDFSQDITFKIYPNPTQDVLFIQTIDSRLPLYLYDLQGRLVRSSPFTPTEVDMKDLPTGMYFLKIDKITVKIHKIQ